MKSRFPALPAVPAMLGLAFSIWNAAAPQTVPCGTSGCSLYAGSGSQTLWLLSAGAFGVLLYLCARAKHALAARLAAMGLVADAGLLALLVLTAPCLKCLIIGLLLFLTAKCADAAERNAAMASVPAAARCAYGKPSAAVSAACAVWSFFFLMGLGRAAGEAVPPWTVAGSADGAEALVYFSPSCPHCLEAARRWQDSKRVAFVPVLDREDDLGRVVALGHMLNVNPLMKLSEGIEAVSRKDAELPGFFGKLAAAPMVIACLADTARAGRAGASSLPVVEFRGLPAQAKNR